MLVFRDAIRKLMLVFRDAITYGGIKMNTIFSDFEKRVIDKLLQLDNENSDICLQNMIADNSGLLAGSGDFDFCTDSDKEFRLYFHKELDIVFSTDIKFMQEIEKKLYDIVLLLDYLESEKYILIIDSKREPQSSSAYEQNIPLNTDLQKRLLDIWNKDIKVLLKLKTLKSNKYYTPELYEQKRNTKWYIILTTATIAVSFLGTVFQYCGSRTPQRIFVDSIEKTVQIKHEDTLKNTSEPARKDISEKNEIYHDVLDKQ